MFTAESIKLLTKNARRHTGNAAPFCESRRRSRGDKFVILQSS